MLNEDQVALNLNKTLLCLGLPTSCYVFGFYVVNIDFQLILVLLNFFWSYMFHPEGVHLINSSFDSSYLIQIYIQLIKSTLFLIDLLLLLQHPLSSFNIVICNQNCTEHYFKGNFTMGNTNSPSPAYRIHSA